jgi:hypothetical protein
MAINTKDSNYWINIFKSINKKNESENTMIESEKTMINALLDNQIDLEKTSDSVTPLSLAIYYHTDITVDFLMDRVTDITVDFLMDRVNTRFNSDEAFCMAILINNINVTIKLLKFGADVNAIIGDKLISFLSHQNICNGLSFTQMIYSFNYYYLDQYKIPFHEYNHRKGFLLHAAICIIESTQTHHMVIFLLDQNIDTLTYHGDTLLRSFPVYFPNDVEDIKNKGDSYFTDILTRNLFGKTLESRNISQLILSILYHQVSWTKSLRLLEEYLTPETKDFVIMKSLGAFSDSECGYGYHHTLIYCLQEFEPEIINKYSTEMQSNCYNIITACYRDQRANPTTLITLMELLIKWGCDIREHCFDIFLKSILNKDKALFKMIYEYVSRDELIHLFQVNMDTLLCQEIDECS